MKKLRGVIFILPLLILAAGCNTYVSEQMTKSMYESEPVATVKYVGDMQLVANCVMNEYLKKGVHPSLVNLGDSVSISRIDQDQYFNTPRWVVQFEGGSVKRVHEIWMGKR